MPSKNAARMGEKAKPLAPGFAVSIQDQQEQIRDQHDRRHPSHSEH
jgi:hypothetical protein